MTKPKRLLFVCLGNIVRSPLAEHLFRHVAQQRGLLNGYEVDSAGTSRAHVGEAPDPRMRRTAAKHGLHYNGSARRIQYDDLDRFDLVIAMDQTNFTDLRLMASSPDQLARIHLMREFDPHA
ncbi:MAG: low molecular weight phosphotyrosine protein phosphatase, partial [Anaerolineae bacterium]|nr:low molecular weight phosphotyrosine protein phosphatase [Anaerolineae bacterium]NIN97583.1 low molecular weight phosphotyrosine protein phosphatase [Anaerolineae bacterium]